MPTSCDIEIFRYLRMKELREFYIYLCFEFFGWEVPPKNSFGRWLIESLPFNTVDPLIPNNNFVENPLFREISEDFPNKIYPILDFIREKSKLYSYLNKYLTECRKIINKTRPQVGDIRSLEAIYRKIEHIPLDRMGFKTAHRVIKELTSEMNAEMTRVYQPIVTDLIEKLTAKSGLFANEILTMELPPQDYEITFTNNNNVIEFSYISKIAEFNTEDLTKIKMSLIVFDKLRNKHIYNNNEAYYSQFLRDIWIVYYRYTTFVDVDSQSASLQAAVPYKLMDYLAKNFGVDFECFASPMNSYFPRYCSAFLDTDKVFGSAGSFFNFYPTSGSYEANPPFGESVMKDMVSHMENLLMRSPEPLSFAVFVPRWEDAEAIINMKSSNFLKGEVIVQAGEHIFRQSDQLKEFKAVHDTVIFFLQNNAGAEKWPVTDEKVSGLIRAFGRN